MIKYLKINKVAVLKKMKLLEVLLRKKIKKVIKKPLRKSFFHNGQIYIEQQN
jgi:hypothetical protein